MVTETFGVLHGPTAFGPLPRPGQQLLISDVAGVDATGRVRHAFPTWFG